MWAIWVSETGAFRTLQNSWDRAFYKNILSWRLKSVNYFCKTLHLSYLAVFWICLWVIVWWLRLWPCNSLKTLPYVIMFTGISKKSCFIKNLAEIDQKLNLLNNYQFLKTGCKSFFPSPRLLVGLTANNPYSAYRFDLGKDFQLFVVALNTRIKAPIWTFPQVLWWRNQNL